MAFFFVKRGKMISLKYLTIKELKMLAKTRSIDGYDNMSRQQLESIFAMNSSSKPTPKPKLMYTYACSNTSSKN